jgi:N6-adenosine-specific RNA methylase IME4
MDVAAAQQVFAQRQRLGEEAIGHAHAVKMRALARLGELLKDLPKAKGARGQGRPAKGGTRSEPPKTTPTLAEMGVSKKVASVAQQLADLPDATREAIAQRETTIAQVRRKVKAAAIREAASLPDAKFRVLYADPPWSYNDKADAGSVQAGGTGIHYPSMSIAELCALPIRPICDDHAVLFLWVTSPLLAECWPVIEAWGFAYKASFVWDKVKHNMGHYNSVRHELLLLCTRGSCTPDSAEWFDSVQSVERTTHSAKPEIFRSIIDTLYPIGKRLELFARSVAAPGWAVWGNEATA